MISKTVTANLSSSLEATIPSVYQYTSARRFLLDTLAAKQKLRPGFSLRQWSIKMGMKSHTLLTLLLQGKRPLRLKHLQFLTKGLSLDPSELRYFQGLIQLENAPTPEDKDLCRMWLADLHPGGEFRTHELDEFAVVSNWIHMAILSMSHLKGFVGDPESIRKRLRVKVSTHEIRSAIERMVDLGLCTYDESGVLRTTYDRVVTKNDVAVRGVREYHKQVIDLARSAIEEQSLDEREFHSFSMSIKKENLPLAKEMIRKFRLQFAKAVGVTKENDGDELYQTNIQFFALSERDQNESDH